MSHDAKTLRRASDLAPKSTHNPTAVSEIHDDAQIGRRQTDDILGKRFTKADTSKIITNNEMYFDPTELIISRTDTRGTITHCNDIFAKMSGWSQEELLGSNHNLIRHPDVPQIVYQLAWDLIRAKKEFYGYVKNLRKDGGFYWVFAYITADMDNNGEIAGYTSYRRFAPKYAVSTMEPIYKLLMQAEISGGMEMSEALLNKYLKSIGFTSYDAFIIDLQVKANKSVKLKTTKEQSVPD